jgi:hypothetical protein
MNAYYVFNGSFKCGNRIYNDHLWVHANNQESARLAALATWPDVIDIQFERTVLDEDYQ